MNQTQESHTVGNTPHSFSELVKVWLKITKMTELFFIEELSHVSISNTFIGVIILAFVSAVFSAVSLAINGSFSPSGMPGFPPELAQFWAVAVYVLPVCGLIATPVSFYLSNGLTYLAAHLLGGKGDFKSQAYLLSLFYVPIGIISTLIGLLSGLVSFSIVTGLGESLSWIFIVISIITGLISLAISVYQIILTIRVLKAVHEFSTGRAVGAVLLPVAIVLLLMCILSMLLPVFASLMGGITHSRNSFP